MNPTIHVIHKRSEISISLSKFDTISTLRDEVFAKTGIAPENQMFESWGQEPRDNDDLIGICCPFENNYLMLSEVESNRGQRDTMSATEDDLEETAAFSFVEQFTNNYDCTRLIFHVCRLKDALELACFKPLNERKIVVLLLNNRTDKFAKIFATNIIKPEISELLNNNFFLLGWDIENETYHAALKQSLKNYCELLQVTNLIEKKTCAALMIVPVKDSINLFACIKGKVSDKDFLAFFENAAKFLHNENELENDLGQQGNAETDIGSTKFQQMMFDMLGDRDYDNFDYFELGQLKEKIAFALFGPPQEESGYDVKQNKKIDFLYKIILEENNKISKHQDRVVMSFIYNCTEPLPAVKKERSKQMKDYNPKTDLNPIPLFILRKCKNSKNPCRVIIDDTGRVYSSWQAYLTNNKLPKCEMVLPFNGRYQTNINGNVKLERHLSPACGLDVKLLQGTDTVSTIAGLASGGVFIAAAIPAIAVAPVALVTAGAVGVGVGIYSIARSAYTIYDRVVHKETLSFSNSEARGAYLNIVAGSLGFVGAGANMAVSQLAARGVNIGQGATSAVNAINMVNLAASGISIGNSGYDVFDQWYNENQTPSFLTILQLSSSILFFGHAVYNFRGVAAVIEESQTNTLRDYQDSLRSNRHRKTFNKLLKETIRQSNGDAVKGRTEVIKTIRSIQNKDDVFASLTRTNKDMNTNKVRFAANNGNIELNGVVVDMNQFAKMDKPSVITFLQQVPAGSHPSSADIKSVTTTINNNISSGVTISFSDVYRFSIQLLGCFRGEATRELIINTVTHFINVLISDFPNMHEALNNIFPHHGILMKVFSLVTLFLQNNVDFIEDQYQKWLKSKDPSLMKSYFPELPKDVIRRSKIIFQKILEVYYVGVYPTASCVEKLIDFFHTWFAKKLTEYEDVKKRKLERSAHSASNKKIVCSICTGYYYEQMK